MRRVLHGCNLQQLKTFPPRRTIDLARFTVQTFLLHASLVHPIGESGKLKLTSDTTALEFAVNQYLAAQGLTLGNMGDQFKALRGE